jgi:hypothetical protein
LGMRGILHKDYKTTRARLASFGLPTGSASETEPTSLSGAARMTAEVVS